jgi:hypothetical protein
MCKGKDAGSSCNLVKVFPSYTVTLRRTNQKGSPRPRNGGKRTDYGLAERIAQEVATEFGVSTPRAARTAFIAVCGTTSLELEI